MDRVTNMNGNGTRIAFFGPFNISIEYALRLDFSITNYMVKYEAFILGL